jgi:hypothetical protein
MRCTCVTTGVREPVLSAKFSSLTLAACCAVGRLGAWAAMGLSVISVVHGEKNRYVGLEKVRPYRTASLGV